MHNKVSSQKRKKNNKHSKLKKNNLSRLPSEKRKCLNVTSRYQGNSNPHKTEV